MVFVRYYTHSHDAWVIVAFQNDMAKKQFFASYIIKDYRIIDEQTVYNLLTNHDYIGHIISYNCLPPEGTLQKNDLTFLLTAMKQIREAHPMQYVASGIITVNNKEE